MLIVRETASEGGRERNEKEKGLTRKWLDVSKRARERERNRERERRVGEEVGRRVDTFEEGSVDAVAPASQWLLRHSGARAYSLSIRFRA